MLGSENSSYSPRSTGGHQPPGSQPDLEKPDKAQSEHAPKAAFLRQWLLELLSAALIPLSLLAIVLTLALHQNTPIPQWPLGISVNALVSIFTLILKAAIIQIFAEGTDRTPRAHRQHGLIFFFCCDRHKSAQVDLALAAAVSVQFVPV